MIVLGTKYSYFYFMYLYVGIKTLKIGIEKQIVYKKKILSIKVFFQTNCNYKSMIVFCHTKNVITTHESCLRILVNGEN